MASKEGSGLVVIGCIAGICAAVAINTLVTPGDTHGIMPSKPPRSTHAIEVREYPEALPLDPIELEVPTSCYGGTR